LGAEFMVEDNPYEARKIVESGTDCFLMRAWYNSQFWDEFDSVGSLLEVVVDG